MKNEIQGENKAVKPDLPILTFTSPEDFTSWLAKHHKVSLGIWIRLFKIKSGVLTITYAEALDVALCYGWIDGQKKLMIQDHGFKNSHQEDTKAYGLKEIRNMLNDLTN